MVAVINQGWVKQGWVKPSTILFAARSPVPTKAFSFALAQAVRSAATFILFHAYDTLGEEARQVSGTRTYDFAAAAHSELQHYRPLAQRARDAGVSCEIVVRPGLAAHQIVTLMREREIDRIVMGTNGHGAIGKLLAGSVAEAVLRTVGVPVCIVGSNVEETAQPYADPRTILCAVSQSETGRRVINFAADLAAHHGANLILQHVIVPKERASQSMDQVESGLYSLVPAELRAKLAVQPIIASDDVSAELLNQSRIRRADLIVMGAQRAPRFSSIARLSVAYKIIVQARCPVLVLGPDCVGVSNGFAESTESADDCEVSVSSW
jgi:nucleotide-binding universal stress UspA family protein